MSRDDPWSGAGDNTRAEVREIFARHAAARAERAAAEPDSERRRPLPNLLLLPARGWRALSPAGKVLTGLIAAALLALALVKVPPAIENALENEANERAAIAANRERIRRELTESQRPRRALLPAGMPVAQALAAEVAADASRRVAAGTLDGPLGPTSCRPVRRSGGQRARPCSPAWSSRASAARSASARS